MPLVLLLLGGVLPAAEGKPVTLHYVRARGERFVRESEVTGLSARPGPYLSRTFRGRGKTTLEIVFDKDGAVRKASVTHLPDAEAEPMAGQKASLEITGGKARLRQGDKVAEFAVPAGAVVTTAPDWSDIFQVVLRYDTRRGGKQSFPGLWIHPTQAHRLLTFTVEKVGSDEVEIDGKKETLTRYLVRLRSGPYKVWAREDRRVVKILPAGGRAVPVVLDGYQEATRALK
jgi:hypothetical protein